jgi:uncharacterized protein Veg
MVNLGQYIEITNEFTGHLGQLLDWARENIRKKQQDVISQQSTFSSVA